MIAAIVALFFIVPFSMLMLAPFILSGEKSQEEEHKNEIGILQYRIDERDNKLKCNHEMVRHLRIMLAEADERAQMLGEELKKYTAEAKGDCKACMVRRGIVSSERELEIEVGR